MRLNTKGGELIMGRRRTRGNADEEIKTVFKEIATVHGLQERFPVLARMIAEEGERRDQYAVQYAVDHSVDLREPVQEQSRACPSGDTCLTCSLSDEVGGYCTGCDNEYFRRCLKHYCSSNCRACGGGRHTAVPACCGRSPRRDSWDRILDVEVQPYTPSPVSIECRLIPVILPQIARYRIPDALTEIDAWAVPVHKVMNLKGEFRAADLKDFLGLPKSRKLILSTYAPDNYTEILWEKGEELDYQGHAVDYWFPAHFSVYDNDSKYHQFVNAKRQQIHAVRTRSQFVWFRLGEHIPVEFLNPVRNASSALISCQQMYSPFNRSILQKEAQIADKWFPLSTSFFLMRHRTSLPLQRSRVVYDINMRWLMTGLMGRDIHNKPVERDVPVDVVLVNNLRETLNELEAPS